MRKKLRMGAAKVDVTPPVGLSMAGYAGRTNPAIGVHLPLWARAFVCEQELVRVALVVVDTVGFSEDTTERMREAILERTGIAIDGILIATTHTHSGPVTTRFRDNAPDPSYMADLKERIVDAVIKASNDLKPVSIGFAQMREPVFHHNRRKDGQPIDSMLGLVRFSAEDGSAVATWVNYGCHPTILTGTNIYWSPDFPGVVCNELEQAWGGTSAFFNGCLGDVGPYRPEQNFAEVQKVGGGLAGSVLELAGNITQTDVPFLDARRLRCTCLLDTLPTSADLKEQLAGSRPDSYQAGWARDQLAMRAAGDTVPDKVQLEVQGFRIGDVFLACFPGQLFGSWGLELRRRWPDDRLVIVNQANAHAGYFPSKAGWDGGGYEVRSAFMFNSDLPAPLTWEAGQRLIDTALTLA
ncbi:MAG: neutral/alkaline non-lysosomal ceramidase N-terminal domain-containing protein [Gemmatimonadetes bacterium]|nr:neutral/alkaline non-lysosomal ceramidase N-terminal domain-containing protein [Gemmatimonadota bacterium]